MMLSEADALALLEACSNRDRWGASDQRGTLNLITRERRRRALAEVQAGDVVALGRALVTRGSSQVPPSAFHIMTTLGPNEISAQDLLILTPHGFEMTHVDAVGHSFWGGRSYNGRRAEDVVGPEGLRSGGIDAMGGGIVTRCVLLDVAAARGVEHLRAGDGISAHDLDAAEEIACVRVEAGDAVMVRSGLGLRVARGEPDTTDPREGLLADAVAWLFRRDVSVYAGDCIERLPSGYARLPMPLHQIGLAAMGLCILDCPDVESLAATARAHGRNAFLLVIAPLRIPGGTASPVNPLAIF